MLTRLGGQGRGALLNTYRLHTAGLIDRQTFLAVSSELMQHINTRGRAYGRLSYESASSVIADREPLVERAGTVDTPNTSTVKIQQSLETDRKSTRLNSSHVAISYAVFCLKKK